MVKDYEQVTWSPAVEDQCRQLVRMAVAEDLDRGQDWTTVALVPDEAQGGATIVARGAGVVAGLEAARTTLDQMECRGEWTALAKDGDAVLPGQAIARLSGNARDLLTAERPMLNFIGRLSGIASLTAKYVAAAQQGAVSGKIPRLLDTRKTTPGWRLLEKYAVRCGGGHNHRLGLHEAILIKDNHLALGQAATGVRYSAAEAVARAREFVCNGAAARVAADMLIEVEVDRLEQLAEVLPQQPDIVLLDNMTVEQLREAVAMRNATAPQVELEASGGVNLSTIGAIAGAGVERISVGALTHSAIWFDVALDWDAK